MPAGVRVSMECLIKLMGIKGPEGIELRLSCRKLEDGRCKQRGVMAYIKRPGRRQGT